MNLIFLVLAIGGILLAIVFYVRGTRVRVPVYRARTFRLIDDRLAKVQALTVLYAGQPVKRLSLTRVALLNRGKLPIEANDLAPTDPLRLRVKGGASLMGAEIQAVVEPTNEFSIVTDTQAGTVLVGFKYFSFNQGVLLQIFHTGTADSLEVLGTVKDVGRFRPFVPKEPVMTALLSGFDRFVPSLPKDARPLTGIVYSILLVVGFLAIVPFMIVLIPFDAALAFMRRHPAVLDVDK